MCSYALVSKVLVAFFFFLNVCPNCGSYCPLVAKINFTNSLFFAAETAGVVNVTIVLTGDLQRPVVVG
jgi:hypothetical protein